MLGGRKPEYVGALHGTPDPALGDHPEHAGVDQARDMAVEARGGHVGQLGPQLGGGERPVTEKGLHDPQPDRMQEQIGTRHPNHPSGPVSIYVLFLDMRTILGRKHASAPTNRRWTVLIALAAILVETVAMRLRGYRVGGNVVVRCQRDHLFTTIWLPGVSLKSLKLGWWRFQHCPVGHHWSLVTPVKEADLTEEDRRVASQNKDIRIP